MVLFRSNVFIVYLMILNSLDMYKKCNACNATVKEYQWFCDRKQIQNIKWIIKFKNLE